MKRRKGLVLVGIAVVLIVAALFSGCSSNKKGAAMLTITGNIGEKNAGENYEFTLDDLKANAIKQSVTDPWVKQKDEYTGIALQKILEITKAEGATTLTLICKDGMKVDVAAKDVKEYPIMLAFEIEGKAIDEKGGGPVKVVYPYDDYPELEQMYSHDQWAWYIEKVEIE